MTMPPIHSGMRDLAARYDGLIVDLWGVVHNGKRPYPGVLDCFAKLKAAGKRVLLLSNAPRQGARVHVQLSSLGVPRDLYEDVVTSGDVARLALERRDDPDHARLGRRFYFIGPERDYGAIDGLGYAQCAEIEAADFVVVTGLIDDERETAADYGARLAGMKARGQPLLCLNPDLSVIRGDTEIPCAGVLGAAYENIGGKVVWHGKPHARAYAVCFEHFAGVARTRLVGIGDRLDTDIAGARNAGIDALLVSGGVLAESLGIAYGEAPDPARLGPLLAGHPTPSGVIPGFVW